VIESSQERNFHVSSENGREFGRLQEQNGGGERAGLNKREVNSSEGPNEGTRLVGVGWSAVSVLRGGKKK